MDQSKFIKKNNPHWQDLHALTIQIEKKGFSNLSAKDVENFLYSFRHTSHNLAYARTHYPNSDVVTKLNTLTGKAHNYIYAIEKSNFRAVKDYFLYEFPNAVKTFKFPVILSTLIFAIGGLLAFVMVMIHTDNALYFVPASTIENLNYTGEDIVNISYPLISSQIMTNNIRVCLLALAMGLTFGLGTIYVLFFNGALLGAIAGLIYQNGSVVHFWSLILPHGVIELLAIFISGGAGLLIAKSMLIPGQYSRASSIVKASKTSMTLLGGVVVMLVIAGIIEGFFTPLNIPPTFKLSFALVTAVLSVVYFGRPYLKNISKTK